MRTGEISLHLIVKDEEPLIGAMLQKLSPFVGEIIVVDTGSTDNTAEIARRYTRNVFSHPFNHDFSEARNYALGKATKPWILQVDVDEQPIPAMLSWIGAYEPPFNVSGVSFMRHNLVNGEGIGSATTEWHIRLWHRGYTFVGSVHEILAIPSLRVVRAPESCFIRHYKTEARQARQNALYAEWEAKREPNYS